MQFATTPMTIGQYWNSLTPDGRARRMGLHGQPPLECYQAWSELTSSEQVRCEADLRNSGSWQRLAVAEDVLAAMRSGR